MVHYSPLLFWQVLSHHFGRLLSGICGAMGVFQFIHVHSEGHGVWRGQVLAEAERGVAKKRPDYFMYQTKSVPCTKQPYQHIKSCVNKVQEKVKEGYDLALSGSTKEYAEISCANVWTSLVFCLLRRGDTMDLLK